MSLPAWPFRNAQDQGKATGRWGPGARPSWRSSLPSCHLSKTPPGTSSASSPLGHDPGPPRTPSSSVTFSLVQAFLRP